MIRGSYFGTLNHSPCAPINDEPRCTALMEHSLRSPRRMSGDGFQVPVATPHAGAKNGNTKTVVISTYVVEKGKPLASPA